MTAKDTAKEPKKISIGIVGILVILDNNGDENIISDSVMMIDISLLIKNL